MDEVSRETSAAGDHTNPPSVLPETPVSARRVFSSERLQLAEEYAASLASDGVVRGLIGPREVPRLWERHLVNCAVLGEAVPEGVTVCDVGSGAGLPGLVLAIARPDLRLTLVEPLLRRTTYLNEVVEQLGLANVTVVRGRAEELHGRERYDVVTSRAVAPLERLLRWSMPLVAPHGALLAMKGSSVDDEVAEAAGMLAKLGCAAPERLELGADVLSPPTIAVRVAWADPRQVVLGDPGRGPRKRGAGQATRGRRRASGR